MEQGTIALLISSVVSLYLSLKYVSLSRKVEYLLKQDKKLHAQFFEFFKK